MPKRVHHALTAGKIKTLKSAGDYADGNGLALRVDHDGNQRWIQRLSIDGKQVSRGLGPYPAVSLADARSIALDAYAANRTGKASISQTPATSATPVQTPVAALPAPDLNIPTFAEVASMVLASRAPTWKSNRNAAQWAESFRLYANPVIGEKRIDRITRADVLAVFERDNLWVEKNTTAERTLGRIDRVFRYAIGKEWRDSNPANIELITDALPPVNGKVQHHAALSYTEIPAMLGKLAYDTGSRQAALAFEFLVLNATRATETLGARWAEMDTEAGTWNIPPERMKANRPHSIPLAARSIEILTEARELAGDSELVFPTPRKSAAAMTPEAFRKILRRVAGKGWTVHGLRSSFRDWGSEVTEYSRDALESALAHLVGDSATERSYLRTTKFEERRAVMAEWADYLRMVG